MIAHNLRSAHNVGSLLRTADALGVEKVYFTGYTPYPAHDKDKRLPHEAAKLDSQIRKTALGAERTVTWHHEADPQNVLGYLRGEGYVVCALEQSARSIGLAGFKPPAKVAILLGNEVEGIDKALLKLCGQIVEIPMSGQKESLNVVQAAAIALYHLRFYDVIIQPG